ncbi:peptidase U32 family protein [uncultured Sunxiuqinia sp.]|uniref:peptidase U32 family protein n=1 Tax=uncultured Sunxiuqinia sp. TaxID=1573825 RepID=UPI002AA8EAC1|nr:peptidase U32 family protein [uncultured Sunxiuqinia sp.]
MKRKIELLAPGGDLDSVKAAILAGADAVYCGLDKFNARNRAANISFENLYGLIRLAHKNNCEVFLTLNILIVESELPLLLSVLNKLVNTGIDGIIVQDFGVFYLLSNYFKVLKVHASTQLTTHNEGQIKFLSRLNAGRVNLSRELNIDEIKHLTSVAHQNKLLTEVFVHGSYCISFSGACYMSSVLSGKSGNRGRCSQPCRDRYLPTSAGKDYPLNLKDNSAYSDLRELSEAGVDSLKIEGRIKEFEYVYTVVNAWRKQLRIFYTHDRLLDDTSDLHKVFNRKFSNSFLKGDINKDLFIDNPMSNSTLHLAEINQYASDDKREQGTKELYDEKDESRKQIKDKIDQLSVDEISLVIEISGASGTVLTATVKTPDRSFTVQSSSSLSDKGIECLNEVIILKKLQSINDTGYSIKELNTDRLGAELYLPFKELTALKRRILFVLNDSREVILPIALPKLKKASPVKIKPTLSVLISSPKDISLCQDGSTAIYFQLPNSLKNKSVEFLNLFKTNENLIPWFPSILLGEDYTAAVDLLHHFRGKTIVTNNTGIAYEAYKKGIDWIAGPYLNLTNSYSLLALKEDFNCSGAFISNELKFTQIKSIKKPNNFNLFYSIYHPILMMTSRPCLFHQVTGCKKHILDDSCIQECSKSSTITNLKKDTFIIEKAKGNYHRIYNAVNFLNTKIITDMPDRFSSFFIDLTNIETETKIELDKASIIQLFKDHLHGNPDSTELLAKVIRPSISTQYKEGI